MLTVDSLIKYTNEDSYIKFDTKLLLFGSEEESYGAHEDCQ
jgi:hypothetical protein